MFDVGFSELVLLFVIGLLILGPERLPRVAAQLGRWVGRARRTATQLRLQFEREMTMQDIMKQQRKPPPTKQAPSSDEPPAGQDATPTPPAEPTASTEAPEPVGGYDAPEADQKHVEPTGVPAADQADDSR